jgi:hypothetical protein
MPTRKQPKIEQFDSFVCTGDTVEWSREGFDITATVCFDEDTRPEDSDCYTPRQIQAWREDEWFFCGIVLTVSRNGVELPGHAASLWGIECNFPSRRKNPNAYLAEVCEELQGEAIEHALREVTRIQSALQGVAA